MSYADEDSSVYYAEVCWRNWLLFSDSNPPRGRKRFYRKAAIQWEQNTWLHLLFAAVDGEL